MPPTQEQLRNRQTALEAVQAGQDPNEAVRRAQNISLDDSDTVFSADTTQRQFADFQQPNDVPIFRAQDVTIPEVPEIEATPQEEQAQTLTNQLRSLNQQLIGESQRRGQLRQQEGLPELERTRQDLTARLQQIQAEEQQIPMQIQQESVGRGRTAGGIEPIQASALRKNAIRALSVGALLEANRGNITLAQDRVDRALEQEFGPIREQINANMKNLDLILQSPEFTRQQKNRAQKRKEIENERQRILEEREREKKGIYDIALSAAEGGAGGQTLNDIVNSQTRSEALEKASDAGLFVDTTRNTQIIEVGNRKQLVDTQTGEVIRDLGVADVGGGGTGGGGEAPPEVDITPEDRRILTGAGFAPQEINEVIRAVSDFGVDAVLEELENDRQRLALMDVFNMAEPFDVQENADRLLAKYFEPRFFSTRTGELQTAIDDAISQIENFGISGITEEQQEQVVDALRNKTVDRSEASRIKELRELLDL